MKECSVCGYETPIRLEHVTAPDGSYKAPCLNCGYQLVGTAEIGVPPKPRRGDLD
jgi:hypothetical protein